MHKLIIVLDLCDNVWYYFKVFISVSFLPQFSIRTVFSINKRDTKIFWNTWAYFLLKVTCTLL